MDILNINDLVVCCKPKTDKHFVKEPICLDCLHPICNRCISDYSYPNIQCGKCEKVTKTNSVRRIEYVRARDCIKNYLHNIFLKLEQEAIGYYRKLKRIFQGIILNFTINYLL
jgi:hypothetical protein